MAFSVSVWAGDQIDTNVKLTQNNVGIGEAQGTGNGYFLDVQVGEEPNLQNYTFEWDPVDARYEAAGGYWMEFEQGEGGGGTFTSNIEGLGDGGYELNF